MPRKLKPKPDDPAEYKRFLETAKAVDASDDLKDLDRAIDHLTGKKQQHPKPH